MSRTIFCTFLQREAEGQDFQLYPGELGKRIYNEISKEAWADAPRDKCTLSCAINGIHAAFHYLKKNYISGCVMTVPTGW